MTSPRSKRHAEVEEAKLEAFKDNGWLLITPGELAQGLRKFADRGYEDDIVTMVVKILERNAVG